MVWSFDFLSGGAVKPCWKSKRTEGLTACLKIGKLPSRFSVETFMKIYRPSDTCFDEMKRRMNRRALPEDSVRDTVNAIIQDVSARGDEALFDYASRFDKVHLDSSSLFVTEAELAEAEAMVEGSVKEAIAVSLANIHYFFRPQPQAGLVRRKCAGRGGGGAVPSVRPCGHLYSRRESAPGIHFHHDGRFLLRPPACGRLWPLRPAGRTAG